MHAINSIYISIKYTYIYIIYVPSVNNNFNKYTINYIFSKQVFCEEDRFTIPVTKEMFLVRVMTSVHDNDMFIT